MTARFADWLRRTLTDYTPETGRVFVSCRDCRRLVPHYYLADQRRAKLGCPRCGGLYFRPVQISEWRAAWFVLSRLVWRKVVTRQRQWDPRMPMRVAR